MIYYRELHIEMLFKFNEEIKKKNAKHFTMVNIYISFKFKFFKMEKYI